MSLAASISANVGGRPVARLRGLLPAASLDNSPGWPASVRRCKIAARAPKGEYPAAES